MKLRAPDSGNGDGGAAGPPPAGDTKPAAGSIIGGETKADAKVETKPAEGETKAAPVDTKDAKTETKPDDKAKAAPVLVDEKWAPKEAPKGVERNPKLLGTAVGLFKKLGLNAEQAQALVEFSDAQAAEVKASVEAETAGWLKDLEADKTIGGQKLEATRENVRKLVRSLKSGPAMAQWLDERGIGDAAPLVRAFAELASRVSEDSVKDTVVDPAAAAVNEHERRIAKTYGTKPSNGA